jgi:alpha-ketoglutarate-dependent taurine dioxygenase
MRTELATPPLLGEVSGHIRQNEWTSAIVYPVGSASADPLRWVGTHQEALRDILREQGLCLLRGFPVGIEAFGEVAHLIGGGLLEYTERSTPRSTVSGNIYTSTDYPPDQPIPMHNENSYSDTWPSTLFFFCHTAAATGGATPIADSRAVFRLIPDEVHERFAAGVTYTRTFREGLGLSWQDAFQTTDPAVVDDYCSDHSITCAWSVDALRTRHRRPATQQEPHTGQQVWFNQANLFHISSLDAEIRETLLEVFNEEDLPRNAYLADGTPIDEHDLAEITRAYDRASLAIAWAPGDIMIINNMLMSHGRAPYTGNRRILVAMT